MFIRSACVILLIIFSNLAILAQQPLPNPEPNISQGEIKLLEELREAPVKAQNISTSAIPFLERSAGRSTDRPARVPTSKQGLESGNGQQLVTNPTERSNRQFNLFSRGQMTFHQMLADKRFLALCAAEYAGATLDIQTTSSTKQWYHFSDPPTKVYASFSDSNPLARPFVNLPTPAYYATGLAFATGLNLLGWKLRHSPHLHRVWWVPQLLGSSVSFYSGVENNRILDSQIDAWKHNQPHR